MSIGTAQIGATISSAKKKASDSDIAAIVRLWTNTSGSMNTKPPMNPAMITLRRASRKLPLRLRITSLTIPPSVSPITPANRTPAEYSAVELRLRP